MSPSRSISMAKTTQTGMGALRPKSAVIFAIFSSIIFRLNPRQYWARPISPIRPHMFAIFRHACVVRTPAYIYARTRGARGQQYKNIIGRIGLIGRS